MLNQNVMRPNFENINMSEYIDKYVKKNKTCMEQKTSKVRFVCVQIYKACGGFRKCCKFIFSQPGHCSSLEREK